MTFSINCNWKPSNEHFSSVLVVFKRIGLNSEDFAQIMSKKIFSPKIFFGHVEVVQKGWLY